MQGRGPTLSAAWGLVPFFVWAWLASRLPASGVGAAHYVFVGLLALAARAFPIVNARERPITFFGAVVCAGSILVGPWAAGALAGGAFLADALLPAFRRARGPRARADDAAYVLATVPLAAAFFLLNVVPPLRALEPANLVGLLLAAGVYFGSVVGLRALAARCFATWSFGTPALGVEAAAFGGFLMVAALPLLLRPGQTMIGAGVSTAAGVAVFLAVRYGVLLRTQQGQITAIMALSTQAVENQNEETLYAGLLSAAQNLIAFDRAYLWATVPSESGSGEHLYLRACWPPHARGEAASTLAWGQGLVGRVAARGRGVVITGAADGVRSTLRRQAAGRGTGANGNAALVVPLVTPGERHTAVGVALFLHADASRYAPADLRALQGLAHLVAGTVENVRLHRNIRALASTDGLTGLVNRHRLDEILAEESARASRYGRPLSVVLCDVDDFKRHNDTFGHLSGDDLLRDAAGVLAQGSRAADTVARYGGEEFCVVLPETDRARALVLAERLRAAIAAKEFAAGPNGATVRKTMSFGVAAFPEDVADPESLLLLADQALYRAKRAGKNRVEAAAASVAPAPE